MNTTTAPIILNFDLAVQRLREDFARTVESHNHEKENGGHIIAQAFSSGKAYGIAGTLFDLCFITMSEYNSMLATLK